MINRTQKYQYLQNKALHYHNLKNIRSTIDRLQPLAHHVSSKLHRVIPYMREHQIQLQNKKLMKRLLSIAGTDHPQVINQGYSRFFNIDRPFRKRNPFKQQVDRQKTIDNKKRGMRIMQLKPAIGSTQKWTQSYDNYKRYKNNLSVHNSNKKRGPSLCISVDKIIPKQMKDFGLEQDGVSLKASKFVTVVHEKLFNLPQIKPSRYTQSSLDKFDKLDL